MSTGFEIDLGGIKDLEGVAVLIHQQLDDHGLVVSRANVKKAVAAMLEDDSLGFFLVARKGAALLGCACVSFIWSMEHAGKTAWLEELFVAPENRREGIGTALVSSVLKRASELGCTAVDLEVDEAHLDAGRLYERQGFVLLPRRRWVKKLKGARV